MLHRLWTSTKPSDNLFANDSAVQKNQEGAKVMAEQRKKAAVKDDANIRPEVRLEPDQSKGALVERYLKRKAEVTADDHREFQEYLEQKSRQVALAEDPPHAEPSLVNRRNILKVVAGTAVAGEAAAVGYSWVKGGAASSTPAGDFHAGHNASPSSAR